MSRYAHNIHQVHIADGFSSDCDELIHRCLQLQTLEYQSFCNVWKDLNFGMIYQGRSSGAEIAELSEEIIHIAKHYMVKDTSNFEESVAGLFLVYGLLTLQPFQGFAWLRIVPDDVPAINRIEVVARRERRLDILYILGEVLVKYTEYHAAERDRGMESVLRKYLEGYTSIDKLGVRPRGVFYRQNEELDIIRDLGSITRQYTRAKDSLIGQGKRDATIQYINENLANELSTSLKRVINGMIDPETDNDGDDDDDDDDCHKPDFKHYDAIQAIKTKAMTNTVKPINHLTGIEERQTTKKSPKKKDLKTPTGKIKTGNHTHLVSTSPKKQKTKEKPRNKKYKETPKLENLNNDTTIADLNIEALQKGTLGVEINTEAVDVRDLKMEALPAMIQTENQGRLIDIEVIDNAKGKDIEAESNNESSSSSSDIKTDDELMFSHSLNTKVAKTYKRKRKDMPVPIHSLEFVEQKPTKRTPRDLKRTKIKSKFRRMGMLPVANFKEQN